MDTHNTSSTVNTVLSPLDVRTNPVEVAELLTQWSHHMAAEQTTGQSDRLHDTGSGG